MEENVKVPWWQKTWVVVLACIFIPPAGLALLWVGKKGGMVLRIILTVILGFYSLAWLSGFVGGSKSATVSDQTATKNEVVAEDTSAADKAAAEKAAADKAAADKAAADKAAAAEAAKPENFKATCVELPYDELARFPDRNVGKQLVMTGEIIQVIEGSTESQYRLKLNDNYDQIVLIGYDGAFDQGKILENDIVTFWGYYVGTMTYTATIGGEITIPALGALYYTIN